MPLLTPRSIGNIDGSYPGTPIEVEQDESNPLAIRVKRLAAGTKSMFDKDSLAEAGVVTTESAHRVQDASRGVELQEPLNELEQTLSDQIIRNTDGKIQEWQ